MAKERMQNGSHPVPKIPKIKRRRPTPMEERMSPASMEERMSPAQKKALLSLTLFSQLSFVHALPSNYLGPTHLEDPQSL